MNRIPVIIDCDPGHDDMMALVLAYGSEKLDIKAVTTAAGNNSIDNTTRNTLNVLNYIGANDIRVARGFDNPIVRTQKSSLNRMNEKRGNTVLGGEEDLGASVHGKSGLDGFDFPSDNPMKLQELNAVEMMAKILRESDEKITIISTGPLTNTGMLIGAYPDLVNKIEKISLMGGTSEYVLDYPYMEFNTFMDPEATKIVFESGVPIYMYGYDVTYKMLYDGEFVDNLLSHKENRTCQMVGSLLGFFLRNHNSVYAKGSDFVNAAPVHDACAVAGVIDPSILTDVRQMHVDVETRGYWFDGATICDYTDSLKLNKNVHVVYNMDKERFLNMLSESALKCL